MRQIPQRSTEQNPFIRFQYIFLVFVLLCPNVWYHPNTLRPIPLVSGQSTSSTVQDKNTPKKEESMYDQLQNFTDDELEAICTSRGFELVKEVDTTTGQNIQYSHQDYIDAAKQCLEIEAEMERILQENPNLLQDIEAESRRMMEEKERLEEQLGQLQSLRKQEEESNTVPAAFFSPTTSTSTTTTNEGTNIDTEKEEHEAETEFIHSKSSSSSSPSLSSSAPPQQPIYEYENEQDLEFLDLDHSEEQPKQYQTVQEKVGDKDKNEEKNQGTQKLYSKETNGNGQEGRKGDNGKPNKEHVRTSPPPTTTTTATTKSAAITSTPTSTPTLPQHIKETMDELCIQLRKDLDRLGQIIVPQHLRGPLLDAVRPLIRMLHTSSQSVVDMTKRYLIVMLDGARQKLESNQAKEEEVKD